MRFVSNPIPRRRFKSICAMSACAVAICCSASISTKAETIPITYSFSGNPTGPPVITGTTLTLDGLATGSVLSPYSSLNAIWDPVTVHTHDVVDLTTGLNNGSFSITFADGDTLSGTLFEDDSAVLASGNNTGPFTQTLTFTAGTGQFAGATGSVSGGGVVATTGFTSSGSGTLDAPAIPEPASGVLLLGGLVLVVVRWRQRGD